MEWDVELAAAFPYSKMATLGWVSATRKPEEKALNLRCFFEVAKLDLLDVLRIPTLVTSAGILILVNPPHSPNA